MGSGLTPEVLPSRETVAQRLGESMVVVHLGTNRIYELNETGARLWELLEQGYDRAGIERRLRLEFEVDGDLPVNEIDALLEKLRAERLVEEVRRPR